jgi:hypothetical protein
MSADGVEAAGIVGDAAAVAADAVEDASIIVLLCSHSNISSCVKISSTELEIIRVAAVFGLCRSGQPGRRPGPWRHWQH